MRRYSNRGLLPIDHLESLKRYLDNNQIPYREGRGEFQVLQISYSGGWSPIYYRQDAKEHLTVQAELIPLIRRYLKQIKQGDTK